LRHRAVCLFAALSPARSAIEAFFLVVLALIASGDYLLSPLIRARWRLRLDGRLTTFLVVHCGFYAVFSFYVSFYLARLSSNNVERNPIHWVPLKRVYSRHSCNFTLL
jgi:hypothetical protein